MGNNASQEAAPGTEESGPAAINFNWSSDEDNLSQRASPNMRTAKAKLESISRSESKSSAPSTTSTRSDSTGSAKMPDVKIFRSDQFSDSEEDSSKSSASSEVDVEEEAPRDDLTASSRKQRSPSIASTSSTGSLIPAKKPKIYTSRDFEEAESESEVEGPVDDEDDEPAVPESQEDDSDSEAEDEQDEQEEQGRGEGGQLLDPGAESQDDENPEDVAAEAQIQMESSPIKQRRKSSRKNGMESSAKLPSPQLENDVVARDGSPAVDYSQIINQGFKTLASTRGQKRKRPDLEEHGKATNGVSKKSRNQSTPIASSQPLEDKAEAENVRKRRSKKASTTMEEFVTRGSSASAPAESARSSSVVQTPPTPSTASQSKHKAPPSRRSKSLLKTPIKIGSSEGIRSTMRNSANNRHLDQGTVGHFTETEKRKFDKFKDDFCEEYGIGAYTFNAAVQHSMRGKDPWPMGEVISKTDFWDDIYAVLPYRNRFAFLRFAQRRCINGKVTPYKWNNEQDEELVAMITEHGTKWKEIGLALGRNSEDCQQRWYNRLEHQDRTFSNKWATSELELLRDTMKNAKPAANLAQDASTDSQISWTIVSDRMGNIRTRQQCSNKWRRLRRLEEQTATELAVRDASHGRLKTDPKKGESIFDWILKQEAKSEGKRQREPGAQSRKKTSTQLSDERVTELSDDDDETDGNEDEGHADASYKGDAKAGRLGSASSQILGTSLTQDSNRKGESSSDEESDEGEDA